MEKINIKPKQKERKKTRGKKVNFKLKDTVKTIEQELKILIKK